jgi:hypothetical protein
VYGGIGRAEDRGRAAAEWNGVRECGGADEYNWFSEET